MVREVVKRDGLVEPFDFSKVQRAVRRCCAACGVEQEEFIASMRDLFHFDRERMGVEEIQDMVVDVLARHLPPEVARRYQDYRNLRARTRDERHNGSFYAAVFDIVNSKVNDATSENANKNVSTLNVKRDLIAGATSRKLYREFIMRPEIKRMHDEGVIHYHDCDYRIAQGITNCQLIDLEGMLQQGTVINGKKINPPRSLRTAMTVATQIIAAVSSHQYGGCTISIAHLAPFIRASRERLERTIPGVDPSVIDTLLSQEVKDSVQTMQYQINTLSTSNGQSPFVTVFLNVEEDPSHREETATLIAEVLRQRIEGMQSATGHNINPTFPKLVYALTESNVHEGAPYYYLTELAARCTAKRMVPDYLSAKKMLEIRGHVYPPMGCRSFLSPYEDELGNPKFYGRLNAGVITINLPYLALAAPTWESFIEDLRACAILVAEEQRLVCERILSTPAGIAPILYHYGSIARLPRGARIGEAVGRKGYMTVSIGYAGIADAIGRFGIEYPSDQGLLRAKEILGVLNGVCEEYKEKTPFAYGVYGTPQESLTTKFAASLRRFPPCETNSRRYVTNSYHVPVHHPIDCYAKLAFEAQLQELSTGGAISYVEMPDVSKNPEAVLNLIHFIYDHVMYAEINTTSCDVCYRCGYEGELTMHDDFTMECPQCGNHDPRELYACRRVCGYLGDIAKGTTKGRFDDIKNRVKHA